MKKALLLILSLFFILSVGFYFNFMERNEEKNPETVSEKEPETVPEKPIEENEEENPLPFQPEIVWANKEKRQVVFTFDAGSGIHSLEPILNTLEKYEVKGTFFITGKWAEQNPGLVKKIAEADHEIFNHTYSHPYLTRISGEEIADELDRTDRIISGLTGITTKPFFRPPYGDRNTQALEFAWAEGYRSVYWTIDVLDWKEEEGFTAEQAENRIMDNLNPGTIYLMHIGDNITGEILDQVFSKIQAQGYSIVSLTQGLE